MTTVKLPRVNMPITGAQLPVPNAAQRALLLGHMTSAGTGTNGALVENPSLAQLKTLSGAGSMTYDAANMFRDYNEITPLDVILTDDPTAGAVASIKSILFAGDATEATTIEVGYGSERNGVVSVGVSVGDSDADIAANVAAAFAAKADKVGAVAVDGTTVEQVNFTYNHACTDGNDVPLYVKGYIAGVTATVSVDTAGAGAYDATNVLDVIGKTRYNAIAAPASWGTAYLVAKLGARWNVSNQILDGKAWVVFTDTKSNHITAGDALNEKSQMYIAQKLENTGTYHGGDTFENPLATAAMLAAISTLRLTDGADISAIVSDAVELLDTIGGAAIASLPYHNTPTTLPTQNTGFGWEDTEVTELNDAGCAVLGNNIASNTVLLGEMVTTYKTDTSGNPDVSFKFAEYVDTSSQAREYLMNNLRATYGQSRLTGGRRVGGRTMANETRIRAYFLALCADLGGQEFVLLMSGPDAKKYINNNLAVSIDGATGLVSITARLPLVTQLREINAPVQIVFSLR